jgi:hypothetical protein
MSTPTGNLYLQAYNVESNKYVELPSSLGALSFYIAPSGFINSRTEGFSGFRFSTPVKVDALEMMPINIGVNNITGSGVFQQNIGSFNSSSFNKIDLIKTGYLGGFNLGYYNIATNSINSYNLGTINSTIDSNLCLNIGQSNKNSGSFFSYNIGRANILTTGNATYLIGASNNLYSGQNILVIGASNTLTALINSLSIGNDNTITTGVNLYNFGQTNTYKNATNIGLFGNSNTSINSNLDIIFGRTNYLTNTSNNTLFGNDNLSNSGSDNVIFGNDNTSNGTSENIYGSNNKLSSNAAEDIIFGASNTLSGTTSNTIIGSYNNSDSSAFTLFISGITITGSIAQSKYNQIYMTGAQATGFFRTIGDLYGDPTLFGSSGFNGRYTTTDFSGYSKIINDNVFGNGEIAYGRIIYDPIDNNAYNCFKQNYPYNQKAWVLFLDIGGAPRYDWLPAYNCINLTSGKSPWSGLRSLYNGGLPCGYAEASYSFNPNPTGTLTGYGSDNVNGFYTRTKADTNFTNSRGNTINFDEDGPALYYNNKNTGNLYSLDRIYLTSGGVQNFSRWSGLKPYNSGKAFATGTPFTIYRENLGGGINNFYLGNNNKATFNDSSFILGSTNTLLDNNSSYVFGGNNYLEDSSASYIFGDTNSSLGYQNYIIGNNNEIRSGDYNSIFIGINYTPTGANKIATISLASVDSKIEITPSAINLDSTNRPKINGQNIIIQSEFDTIANSLNSNGPTFTTNTFQDANYDKLANNVLLSSFTYNSGASTSLTSSAQEFSATSTLFLNKFNIFSTQSYTGEGGFNVIYGNHTNSQFSPAWLVVDNSTSGVYYKNDITPFNITPQSGWYATGFMENSLLYTGTSNNFGINLVMGSRQGYASVSTASFGTMYVPFFY